MVKQILFDDKIEREGFLDGDKRFSFLMTIINRYLWDLFVQRSVGKSVKGDPRNCARD